MKNYQKNMKNLFMAFSCMFEQLTTTVYDNLNQWYLKCLMWSSNLNLVFKPTPFKSLLAALAQITAYSHITFMHHIVALHWLCFLYVAGNCPPSVDVVSTMRSMTPMKILLSLEVPGKQNPLVHSDTIPLSCSCTLLLH